MKKTLSQKSLLFAVLLGFSNLYCPAQELTALVTGVEGSVQIEEGHHTQRIFPMRVLAADQELRIAEEGSLSLICSNDSLLRLKGPRTWSLTQSECSKGRKAIEGTYQSFMSADLQRRTRSADGWLEAPVRRSDEILAPGLIISPRQSALLSLRPVFRWIPDAKAAEYRIQGRSEQAQGFSFVLHAYSVDCRKSFADRTVCQAPLPAASAPLAPGAEYQVGVSSKQGRRSPWTRAELFTVWTLSEEKRGQVENLVQAIEAMLDDRQERLRMTAALYAEMGVFSEAQQALMQVLSSSPMPDAGDLLAASEMFIESGPLEIAEAYAQKALDLAPNRPLRAEALLALGRVAYEQRHADKAKEYLQQAAQVPQGLDSQRQDLVKRALKRLQGEEEDR